MPSINNNFNNNFNNDVNNNINNNINDDVNNNINNINRIFNNININIIENSNSYNLIENTVTLSEDPAILERKLLVHINIDFDNNNICNVEYNIDENEIEDIRDNRYISYAETFEEDSPHATYVQEHYVYFNLDVDFLDNSINFIKDNIFNKVCDLIDENLIRYHYETNLTFKFSRDDENQTYNYNLY